MSAFACFLCTPVSLPYLHFYKLCTPLALRKLADRQPNLSTPAATTISLNMLIKLSGYELYSGILKPGSAGFSTLPTATVGSLRHLIRHRLGLRHPYVSSFSPIASLT